MRGLDRETRVQRGGERGVDDDMAKDKSTKGERGVVQDIPILFP
jgi:hypothetical protein